MTITTIDLETNAVTFHADMAKAMEFLAKNDAEFTVAEPNDLLELSGPQMVALYNATCDQLNAFGHSLAIVARFATKEAGAKRIAANLEDLYKERKTALSEGAESAVADGGETPDVAPKERRTQFDRQPSLKGMIIKVNGGKNAANPFREGSKSAAAFDYVQANPGSTYEELKAAGVRMRTITESVRSGHMRAD